MADLLAPGLWWLHGTRGSNVYLVEADDGRLALIDSGFGSSAAPVLAEVEAQGRPLAAILLTHAHRDHSGAAAAVRAATGAEVFLGEETASAALAGLSSTRRWGARTRGGG